MELSGSLWIDGDHLRKTSAGATSTQKLHRVDRLCDALVGQVGAKLVEAVLEPERHLLLRSTPEDERVAIGPFVCLFVVFPCRYVLQ